MKHLSPALVLTLFALAACSSSGSGVAEPAPDEAAPTLTTMLVLKDSGRLQQGDTVGVDLDNISDDNMVSYYSGGRQRGSVAYDALGPAGEGTMMVMAATLNVRRCRSTGCSVVGQVSRGQRVRVWDLAGRWYRYEEGGVQGYINVDHLVLPDAYQGRLFADIRAQTEAYYDRELAGHRVTSYGNVFNGHKVTWAGDEVRFEFYTRFQSGPAAQSACDAMEGISDFVQHTMAQIPGEFFSAYSAGVYYDNPDTPELTDVMIAGMAGAGGAFCVIDG
jgi:hypothetical protein